MPKISFSWEVRLTDIVVVVSCVSTVIFAYADLKSDIRNERTKAELRFADYDNKWKAQERMDDAQDQRLFNSIARMETAIREFKQDVRADLKELRGDLGRTKK